MTAPVPFLSLGDAIDEIRPALDAAYARVLDGGMFIRGGEVAAFEDAFASACGTAHAADSAASSRSGSR